VDDCVVEPDLHRPQATVSRQRVLTEPPFERYKKDPLGAFDKEKERLGELSNPRSTTTFRRTRVRLSRSSSRTS
jgi:hypothetical protein